MELQFLYEGITAFAVTVGLGPILIPFLHKLKFGQEIRGCGPESHLKKAGTPTMGGFMILAGLLVSVLFWCRWTTAVWVAVILTFGHGLIGFVDDYIKIWKHRNMGLTAMQKLVLQLLLAGCLVWYGESHAMPTWLWLPGLNWYWDCGWGYYVLIFLLLVGTTNALNLTDGLDGLVSGVTVPVALTMGFFAWTLELGDLAGFAFALVGSLLGFLVFNHHPAKVFMGDTGSLALGGAVAALAILLKCELLLILLGGVYVAETLSVILQVGSFKLRQGKRIFRMAPLHHHFELGGWGEVKTVVIFTLASCLCCILSFVLWVMKFVI